MRDIIKRNLKGSTVVILFILSASLYIFMLTVTIPEVMIYSGGMKLPDMMPTGYNSDYINSLFESLGEQGRHVYLFHQIPADMIYPFLFGVSNCLILAWLLNRLGKYESRFFYFCLFPLLAGLLDYLENFGIIAMLKTYPHISSLLPKITNIFTICKSLFTSVYITVLIVTLVTFAIKKIFYPAR